jgi:GNAT superfamily N-acetyltransferase
MDWPPLLTHDRHMFGDDIRVRRVAPEDAIDLQRFYAELSADSRQSRFHGASRGISHDQAEQFAAADHRRRDGFVAVAGGRILGHVMLEPIGQGIEELAVAVDDRIQHHGVGTLLLAAAMGSARLRGARGIVAWVMSENGAMRRLISTSQHPVRVAWEGLVARYELEMPEIRPLSRPTVLEAQSVLIRDKAPVAAPPEAAA